MRGWAAASALLLGLGACRSSEQKSPGDVEEAEGEADTDPQGDGDGEGEGGPSTAGALGGDRGDWPFPVDELLEVELELEPADWDQLRFETRSLFEVLGGDCLDGPFESPYTELRAELRVNGEALGPVGVRKKGFIGSLSTTKPGLRIDMDEFMDGGRLRGRELLTLNNTPQDPTMMRTCLAYEVFAAAGVPAPACAFAHLVVNGEDLGLYAHVETPDSDFIERVAGDRDAPFFEGTLSDLTAGWTATFDPDSDGAYPALLDAAVAAVDSGDLDEIGRHIDLPAFYRFWAAEVLVGHWDGYGWNRNNYYVVIDPADGLLRFVPWGPDAAFSDLSLGVSSDWIALSSALPLALARDPEGLAAYKAELQRQLDAVWSEERVLARLDALLALTEPVQRPSTRAVAELRGAIAGQAPALRAGLGRDPRVPDAVEPALCMEELGAVALAFRAPFGGSAEGPPETGGCDLLLTTDTESFDLRGGAAISEPTDRDGYAAFYCYFVLGEATVLPYFAVPAELLRPGPLTLDYTVSYGVLYVDARSTGDYRAQGIFSGDLQLGEAEAVRGAPLSLQLEGGVWNAPW